jgi:AcrR family transcriptional regulator
MSVIARRAGVSLATLRQYFPTPDALFREVIRSTIVRQIPHPHHSGPPPPGQPVVDQIRLFLRQTLRRLEEPDQLALLRLSLVELSEFPELAIFHATEMIGRTVGRLEAMLTEGIRRGEMHLCDVRTAARVIIAALISYGLWLASPGIYGDLIGPDKASTEQAVIDVLLGLARGAESSCYALAGSAETGRSISGLKNRNELLGSDETRRDKNPISRPDVVA